MNSLSTYLESRVDSIGNNIDVGDWIEFEAKGITVMAEVTDTNDDKLSCIGFGFRYSPNLSQDEVTKLQEQIYHKKYNINAKRKIFKLAKPKEFENISVKNI